MQTSPAFAIDIPAQRAWRWMVSGLAIASGAGVLAWSLVPEQALDRPARLGLAATGLLIAAWAGLGSHTSAWRVRWDGSIWWIGPAGCDHDQMHCGNLRVMVGLSFFLLLRFEGEALATRRVRWIPVLRGSLAARWHALCCAVYSARPAEGSLPTGDLPRTALTRPEPHE